MLQRLRRPIGHPRQKTPSSKVSSPNGTLNSSQHLRFEPAGSTKRPVPPPHILTLHMQYWCAVLLLHRPFIRHEMYDPRKEDPNEGEARKFSKKNYELCAGVANHIMSIASLYSDTYTLGRCSVFLCYYIFMASIMHVTSTSLRWKTLLVN
ncbi:hypothetical protein L208DRAFT_677575 [Tricholoma matsutake]|nr:hypothetical protein L208DRAFT_677575 [Tricholoma matsutake 945]